MYRKLTSNFGPPLINFLFFPEDKFSDVGGLLGGGGQAEDPGCHTVIVPQEPSLSALWSSFRSAAIR